MTTDRIKKKLKQLEKPTKFYALSHYDEKILQRNHGRCVVDSSFKNLLHNCSILRKCYCIFFFFAQKFCFAN